MDQFHWTTPRSRHHLEYFGQSLETDRIYKKENATHHLPKTQSTGPPRPSIRFHKKRLTNLHTLQTSPRAPPICALPSQPRAFTRSKLLLPRTLIPNLRRRKLAHRIGTSRSRTRRSHRIESQSSLLLARALGRSHWILGGEVRSKLGLRKDMRKIISDVVQREGRSAQICYVVNEEI
jgi:hypothetical protein